MNNPRPRAAAALAALTLVLAACTSTTGGSGSVSAGPTSAASSHDFPTGSAGTSTGGATPTLGPTPTAPPSGTTHPVPPTPVRTVTAHSPDGGTYVVKIWADVEDATCFDHAYGAQMVRFLTEHPCAGLRRYLATTTVKGRPVGFALSSTGFHGPAKDPYRYAGEFVKLERADGTGSINDLMREGYRLPEGPTSIPSSETFNVLGQDEGVTVWDVWYLDGPTPNDDKTLIKMTEELFLQI